MWVLSQAVLPPLGLEFPVLTHVIRTCVAHASSCTKPESHASLFFLSKVFQSMFEFLDENWPKLSPGVMEGLKDRPLVPVGARLIKASRLFFRLKVGVWLASQPPKQKTKSRLQANITDILVVRINGNRVHRFVDACGSCCRTACMRGFIPTRRWRLL